MDIYSTRDEQRYWAREDDPELVVSGVRDKIAEYTETLRNTRMIKRIMRSWRYYHGIYFKGSIESDTEIKALGEQEELVGIAVNDFRSLIQQIVTMVTKNRPAFDVRAVNSDLAALHQSRDGKAVLETYLRDKGGENFLKTAVEHAMIFNVGYTATIWDSSAGDPFNADPETGKVMKSGDVRYFNPTIFDLAYDVTRRSNREWQWVAIRDRVNKYDLATRHPDLEEEIVMRDEDESDKSFFSFKVGNEAKSDCVDVWTLYHVSSDALEEGRQLSFVGDEVLDDGPFQYEELPVDRCTSGELLLTCFGYSTALDMQGPQEALNAEVSTICTNHKSFGVGNIWMQEGDEPKQVTLPGGLNVVISQTKPEFLNFAATPPEIFKFADTLAGYLERLSGVNSVRRGQPEGALRGGSGAAFALLDAKAVEANAGIINSYAQMLEGVGTKTLRLLNHFPGHPRVMAVIGKHKRAYHVTVQKDSFKLIDRVIVQVGNPLMNTSSGRMAIADILIQQKRITTEEYITFLNTGEVEPMFEAAMAQLSLVREENEAMLDGRMDIKVLAIDDHKLHIKEHAALLNTTEARNDQGLVSLVLAHVMQHIQALQIPAVQMHQIVLGYELSLPAMAGNVMPQTAQAGGPPGQGGAEELPQPPNARAASPRMPRQAKPAQGQTAQGTVSEGGIAA